MDQGANKVQRREQRVRSVANEDAVRGQSQNSRDCFVERGAMKPWRAGCRMRVNQRGSRAAGCQLSCALAMSLRYSFMMRWHKCLSESVELRRRVCIDSTQRQSNCIPENSSESPTVFYRLVAAFGTGKKSTLWSE
eukprot:1808469-Rhodomonas_salina.1